MTRRWHAPLAVVGGGLAGLSAAVEARRHGLETTLIEQRASLRGPRKLIADVNSSGAEVRLQTAAWGIWSHDIATWSPHTGSGIISADQIILATGAHERPVAFPGWTLPGVITATGARRLLEQGVSPGKRVLVAGYGAWLRSVASDLRAGGVYLVDVVDASARIARTVVRAEGQSSLERVVIARAGVEQTIAVDALILAFGLLPENQLARLAGCVHTQSTYVSPITVRDEWMRTSVPGVLVAGDAGGICGPALSPAQGRLAGLTAAFDAGSIDRETFESRWRLIRRRLTASNDGYADTPPAELHVLTPDTVICRCEDVTVQDMTERIFAGSIEPAPMIAETRAAMGMCQGRNCASLVAAVISCHTGIAIDRVTPITPRPPVVPVPLGGIAERPPEFDPLPDLPA